MLLFTIGSDNLKNFKINMKFAGDPVLLKRELEKMAAPVGVTVSSGLFSFLRNSFSPHFERAFLLFERQRVIQKAIESNHPNSPRSFSFIGNHVKEVVPVLENAGFAYVGTYHHHLDSDRQVALKLNPPIGQEAYQLPNGYDPTQLSPDDRGIFNRVGFSFGEMDDPTVTMIREKIKYLLLGNFSQSRSYRARAYTVLSEFPQTHPWNIYREDLAGNGFMLDHYRGFDDILEHPIEVVDSPDGDVEALFLLGDVNLKNNKEERPFENAQGRGVLRIFTADGKLSFVEVLINSKAKRYHFSDEGTLERLLIYGDNTTSMDGYQIDEIEENLAGEKAQLFKEFPDIQKL